MQASDFITILGMMFAILGPIVAWLVARDRKSDKRMDKAIEKCEDQRLEDQEHCEENVNKLQAEVRGLHVSYHKSSQEVMLRLAAAVDTIAVNSGARPAVPAKKKSDRLPVQERQ